MDVDEREAAMLELAAGEMSLHHVRLIHGSDPNPSDDRRIGFAIRYIPTYVRQVAGSHDSATLVRGEDRYRHFEPEQRPDADMSPGGGRLPRRDHRRARADPDARHRTGDACLRRRRRYSRVTMSCSVRPHGVAERVCCWVMRRRRSAARLSSITPLPIDHIPQRRVGEIRAEVLAEQIDCAMPVLIAVP